MARNHVDDSESIINRLYHAIKRLKPDQVVLPENPILNNSEYLLNPGNIGREGNYIDFLKGMEWPIINSNSCYSLRCFNTFLIEKSWINLNYKF